MYYYSLFWQIACPPSTMVAKTACILVGGCQYYTSRLVTTMNNNITWIYFILTITRSLPWVVGDNGIDKYKKYT